jgi:hypothetical protein
MLTVVQPQTRQGYVEFLTSTVRHFQNKRGKSYVHRYIKISSSAPSSLFILRRNLTALSYLVRNKQKFCVDLPHFRLEFHK